MKMKKTNERIFWIGITAMLLTLIVLLSFSPRVLATGYEAETQQQLGLFYEVLRFVQDNYVEEEAVAPEILIEGALKGMFEALDDPHSAYLSREEMRDLNDTTTGRFGGVGLIISKVERGAEVVSPIEDTPAYRAGITAGDIIIAIEDEPIIDFTIDEVVKVLRGEPGAPVRVTILRGKSLTFDVTIIRAMIEVPTVKRSMIDDKIGYLRIIQFTPLTPGKVREALAFFENNGYASLIVDLRSNPGGLLASVIDVADFFISRGPIVSTRSRVEAENHVFYSSQRETIVPSSIPVVVLINRGSASASEILAGALKDTSRAQLMGETSYGKGSVQQIKSIGEAGFRLTMSRYYTPSGVSIDKVGITPDTEVREPELTEEEEAAFTRLIEGDYVARFVEEHPAPGEAEITVFINTLRSEDIDLGSRIIRRLVRNELNRTNNNPPVYDLDFDLVLRQAVDTLRASE
jgi:carboxyl-terminal processing protease